ncbi:MAG: galactonate dehydratase [Gammaproteobacteria bacterium]|nr:galactonate dehydratase [Gammaproteobacteria bacterium]
MRITRLTTYAVPPRWLFLKVDTDAGITGWGEPIVEGRAATVAAAVDELADYLVGQDPMRIEDHWQAMFRGAFYRGGPVLMSAIAGLDQALWDIKGKHFGAPVWELMGGACRDRVRVYSWVGGESPDAVVESVREARAGGFDAVKMTITSELQIIDSFVKVDEAVAKMAAIRDAFGNEVDVGIDFHGRVHKPMAKVLAGALAPYRPLFLEEPVQADQNDSLIELARHTTTRIAIGERMYSRHDFKRLLEQRVVDILQPDLSHAGGLTEVRKIATMAEAYDVALAPHCPLGPIALAACLQIDAVCHNAFIQEQSLGVHRGGGSAGLGYLRDPDVFAYADGFVDVPRGPGLGIEIDESVVEARAKEGHRWRNPLWRHQDGSVAEW